MNEPPTGVFEFALRLIR